jgi:dipicolinate synthase subunit B
MCGSFCTFDKALAAAETLAKDYNLVPIMSETAYATDTRFGDAESFRTRLETVAGQAVIHTIKSAEPIGPSGMLDALVIAPATGNTLSKLARGITDTAVTMAAKAHLRRGKPVVVAVSTNDALSGSAESIARLLNRKHVYFVPLYQDDATNKPNSLAADLGRLPAALAAALAGQQLQPLFVCN